jgi:hypothetical protein
MALDPTARSRVAGDNLRGPCRTTLRHLRQDRDQASVPIHPASTSSFFQLTMAPSTRSIGSTNVSSSSEANAPRPRIEPGWRRTISLGLPRRGTRPSSKTKACQPGAVSASSAPYVSGQRCAGRGCRSSPGYRSSLRCTTTPSASTR